MSAAEIVKETRIRSCNQTFPISVLLIARLRILIVTHFELAIRG